MAVEVFFAAVSAISAVTQVMMAQQDRLDRLSGIDNQDTLDKLSELQKQNDRIRMSALEAGRRAYNSSQWNIRTNATLQYVERRIPATTLQIMADNVKRCWERLEHFISDDKYTPEERSEAHRRNRQCVCTELQEMLKYLGTLPEELQALWNACGCPNPQ